MAVMTRNDEFEPEPEPERPQKGNSKGKSKAKAKGDYEVGWGKPPKAGQIQKGEVRNKTGANGKKPKVPKPSDFPDIAEIGAQILCQKISATTNGKPVKISYLEFLMKQDLVKAAKSDAPIYKTLIGWKNLGVLEYIDKLRWEAEVEFDKDPANYFPAAFLEAIAEIEGNVEADPHDEDIDEAADRDETALEDEGDTDGAVDIESDDDDDQLRPDFGDPG